MYIITGHTTLPRQANLSFIYMYYIWFFFVSGSLLCKYIHVISHLKQGYIENQYFILNIMIPI